MVANVNNPEQLFYTIQNRGYGHGPTHRFFIWKFGDDPRDKIILYDTGYIYYGSVEAERAARYYIKAFPGNVLPWNF